MKKSIVVFGIVIFLSLAVGGIYYFFEEPSPSEQNLPKNLATHPPCLSDNEIVTYNIDVQKDVSPVDIIVKDKNNEKENFRFTIDSVLPVYSPVQPRKCGVYALRVFNYNPKISKQAPGYKDEIWYYSYEGRGKPLLLLSFKDEAGIFHNFFNLEFSVDFLEIYLALIRGYLSHIDFATVIKEIETENDVFSLKYEDIINKYPDLLGSFGLKGWTKDSHYFWGDIAYGANVLGFFRIERDTWKVDILSSPENVLGGDALNVENGYITVHPGNVWFGVAQITEEEKEKRRKQGIGTELYIHNLITGDKQFVTSTTEPLWYFKPRWLSDIELEYELPTGEKKIYEIKISNNFELRTVQ